MDKELGKKLDRLISLQVQILAELRGKGDVQKVRDDLAASLGGESRQPYGGLESQIMK